MMYIDMDSMMEYWAAQGPYYYVIARLVARPDLTTEDIITEYCDAFGDVSPEIRRYLAYWEEYQKVALGTPPSGEGPVPGSIYETVCLEHFGKVLNRLAGHWQTMPYIYTPEVLAEARSILNEATSKTKDGEVKKRVDFLRDGLTQVEKTSKVISAREPYGAAAVKDLESFCTQMEEKYGYWGSNGIAIMRHWGVIGEPQPFNTD
jgi:hypothetical protein